MDNEEAYCGPTIKQVQVSYIFKRKEDVKK